MGQLILIAVIAALVAMAATPFVRRLAMTIGAVDQPSARKVHRVPIPRIGGLAVFAGWVVALIAGELLRGHELLGSKLLAVAGIGGIVILLGLWDDWLGLSGRVKLVAQIFIASLVFFVDARIDRISNPFGGELLLPWPVSYAVTVFWIIGMMNALNLIDGLDGLAAGIAGITAFGLIPPGLYLHSHNSTLVLAALGGACLGFLRYNFNPASIFLGDTGSQLLGYVFAVTALIDDQYKAATAVALLVPLTALGLPIYDTALAFIRRIHKRRSIFAADKFHLHHRLLRLGLSQRQVVLFLYLVSIYMCCLALLFVLIPERYVLLLLVLLALGLLMGMQTMRFIELKLLRRFRRRRWIAAHS